MMAKKRLRVIEETTLISSYLIEVDEDANLDELFDGNAWEEHVLIPVYEADPHDTHIIEAWDTTMTVDDNVWELGKHDIEKVWDSEGDY